VHVAKRLENCMRSTDVVSRVHDRCTISRFGGDEFVLLLRGLAEPANAGQIADRILAELAHSLSLQGHEVTLSGSIGIAVGREGLDSADDLLRDADTAMYQAKSQGKARWCMFDQSMRKEALERLALEADLLKGIEREQFHIHYQPIVELPSQRIRGFEALLRWKHPTRGNVSPVEFVPIAEEIGFIVELGTWVLEQACRQVKTWQQDFPHHAGIYISVNVSTKQFIDPRLVERVRECLQRTGLEGRSLKLEITESAIMIDPQVAAARLEQLRALGVQISLDDFGTGYSSLSYLQSFKIDTLKIDRSFISRLGVSEESDEIVRTIVNLAHNLGMQVVAEGIELASQQAHLELIACEAGQGYLYSRPVAEVNIETLLQHECYSLPCQCDAATAPWPVAALEAAVC
jgi:EAL domain-containing protein (putative c-di-GMP-specific phosphodiesterase class I)